MERIDIDKKYRVVSLFAGIGGFDIGFQNAGFDIIWANDFDKYACETYKANVGDNIVCDDIRNQLKNIPDHDILIGGFPCQPFSTLGKLKGFEDDRGTMFFYIKQIAEEHDTKILVLENVKNIMHHNNGKTFKKIITELEKMGYLEKPHTSAGRVPSAKGYRYYVDELLQTDKITLDEIKYISDKLETKVNEIEDLTKITANTIPFIFVPS